MTEITGNVSNEYLEDLLNGSKKIEGRLNIGKWRNLKEGDLILFNNQARFTIIRIINYKDFSELLMFEGIRNVLPRAKSYKDAVNIYDSIYLNVGPEGVLALELVLESF
jgi:ASC-1-like (ASCH) protein